MNYTIEKILSQVYELEGLLLVVENHKDNTPTHVYEMIHEKASRINELVQECNPAIYQDENPPYIDNTQESEESIELEDQCDNDNSEVAEDNDILNNEICEEPDTEKNDIIAHSDDEQTEGEEQELLFHDEYIDIQIQNEVSFEKDTEIENPESENDSNDDGFYQEILEDGEEIIEEAEEDNFEQDIFSEDIEDDFESIKLDEALQRNLSKDLSKAFTLNDKFRYRRELFGNSEVEMRNTINMIEAMKSYSEAEDYFYGDLEWDKESPEVIDFMSIIQKHFL